METRHQITNSQRGRVLIKLDQSSGGQKREEYERKTEPSRYIETGTKLTIHVDMVGNGKWIHQTN